MKCPNCGELIKEKKKMNFCGYCGANLKTGEKTFTSSPANNHIQESIINNNIPDFTQKPVSPATVQEAPKGPNQNFASPFERMAQENAAPKETNSFQTTVTPPPFSSFQAAPDFSPVLNQPAKEEPIIPDTPVIAQAPKKEVKPPVSNASPLGSFDPASLSMFDPYKLQQNAAAVPPVSPVPQAPVPPVQQPVQQTVQQTVQPFTPNAGTGQAYPAQDPGAPGSVSRYNQRLSLLIEELEAQQREDEKAEQKAPAVNQSPTAAFAQAKQHDISENLSAKNTSGSSDTPGVSYMEYTRKTEAKPAEPENKFSAFSFTSPEAAKDINKTSPAENADDKKEEARKAIDESVESILDFTASKKPQALENTASSLDFTVTKNSKISFEKSDSAVKDNTPAGSDTEPAKAEAVTAAPEKPAEPAPAPEPEVIKEKVINYVGQEKKAAVQMINFKGLIPEIEYVENEKDYNIVIAQSIPADSEVLPGTKIKLTVSAGTWSDWEENPMPVSPNNFITETKTQYRKRSRTRTTDKRDTTDSSEYEGYTLTGSDSKYSDWTLEQYYSSEVIPPGPTCEIVRVASGFKYAGWFNPANMNGMSFSSPDVANFFNTNLNGVKWVYEEIISEQNIKPDVKNWKLVTDNMNSTPAGDPMISNIFFSAHVLDGKSYAMKFGSSETEWYIYKKRTLIETVYHFEKEIVSDWSEWSEWSETPFTESEDCEVEKKVLTRSRRKIPNN